MKTNDHKVLRSVKRLLTATLLIWALSPLSSAWADGPAPVNPNGVVDAINNQGSNIVSLLKIIRDNLNVLFRDAFTGGTVNLTNEAKMSNTALLNPKGGYNFEDGASTSPQPAYGLVADAAKKSAAQKTLVALSNKDADARIQVLLSETEGSKISDVLDAQNLLGNSVYTTTMQNNAEKTISFLSDYTSPVGTTDLAQLEEDKKATGEAKKKTKVRMYTSVLARSLILGNLYEVFNARVPIKGLGQLLNMPDNMKNASIVQAEEYLASRRVKDPEWFKTMDTAPAIAVQREMAFILAGIQWQLYQLHRDNEKILLTQTVQAMLTLRATAAMPSKEEIQEQVNKANDAVNTKEGEGKEKPNMENTFQKPEDQANKKAIEEKKSLSGG